MNYLYDYADMVCADALGVDRDTYIEIIDSISEERAKLFITIALGGDDEKIKKAKRIFNEYLVK
jgi:hypothetical protein